MRDIRFRIKCIRKENNLNQSQFAQSIGISQGNFSEIEMGNSNPSAETLISIRVQYNVNLNWLLTGNDTKMGAKFEDKREEQLIKEYRSLSDYDKIEIIEIVQMKNRLRSKV